MRATGSAEELSRDQLLQKIYRRIDISIDQYNTYLAFIYNRNNASIIFWKRFFTYENQFIFYRFIKYCKTYATLSPDIATQIKNLIIYVHEYNVKVAQVCIFSVKYVLFIKGGMYA